MSGKSEAMGCVLVLMATVVGGIVGVGIELISSPWYWVYVAVLTLIVWLWRRSKKPHSILWCLVALAGISGWLVHRSTHYSQWLPFVCVALAVLVVAAIMRNSLAELSNEQAEEP